MVSSEKHSARPLRLYFVAWLFWTLLSILTTFRSGFLRYLDDRVIHWWHIFSFSYTSGLLWSLFTVPIYWLVRRFPLNKRNWGGRLLLHLALGLGISAMQRMASLSLDYLIQTQFELIKDFTTFSDYFGSLWVSRTIDGILTYFLIVAILYGYRYYLDYKEARRREANIEAGLIQAQLASLQFQLQPHFIYNSLQVISSLIHRSPEQADDAIVQLGDMLRHSAALAKEATVEWSEEIAFTKNYIALQQLRFAHQFQVSFTAEAGLEAKKLPMMTLQPLIENAIKHGFSPDADALKVVVKAHLIDDQFVITVEDDGLGLGDETQWGTGLQNLKDRLDLLYPENHHLEIANRKDERGCLVSVRIPML